MQGLNIPHILSICSQKPIYTPEKDTEASVDNAQAHTDGWTNSAGLGKVYDLE